jgi:Domain of unknown function (DUF6134)
MIKFPRIIGLTLFVSTTCMILPVRDTLAKSVERSQTFVSPIHLYGNEISFDVHRNGEKVGFHRVRFDGGGEALTVESNFQLRIEVLFVPVFRYAYRSEGRWRDGRLESLHVTLDDDGKRSALNAIRDGDIMRINQGDRTYTTRAPLYPTNHWNAGVLVQDRVLNTLTGRLNAVRIEPVARETVTTERGTNPATRYAYSGDLETEVWYDDAGRWVKMRFAGRDGSTIEYICRRCQGGDHAQATK